MSDPFGEQGVEPILEGFLCPICKADLKTPDWLTSHVESEHSEQDPDILQSFRGMLLVATKKIRNEFASTGNDSSSGNGIKSRGGGGAPNTGTDSQSLRNTSAYPPIFCDGPEQTIGVDMDHTAYFTATRSPRLERYAMETNRLIIRLNKLLTDRPTDSVQRKQHEQMLVPWVDGKLVKLCPNCARRFLLTRRKHHCRLCGSIMCQDCSLFLAIDDAISLVNPTSPQTEQSPQIEGVDARVDADSLRVCDHCLHLLENRKDMQDSRTYRPPICLYYDRIEKLKQDVEPDCKTYSKMVNSLLEGDTVFTLADAGALRAKIGRVAESMDAYSKAILTLECQQGSQPDRLQRFVRLACVQYIKERMLDLDALPSAADVEAKQLRRRQEAEQRIERERRLAMEHWERTVGANGTSANKGSYSNMTNTAASGSALTSIDNWSTGHQASSMSTGNDPLVEQINIIKGYIKQARDALRFEEVEILELNLRELQQEFYNRQQQMGQQSD